MICKLNSFLRYGFFPWMSTPFYFMCQTSSLLLFSFGCLCNSWFCLQLRLFFSMEIFKTIFKCSYRRYSFPEKFKLTACERFFFIGPEKTLFQTLFTWRRYFFLWINKFFFEFLLFFICKNSLFCKFLNLWLFILLFFLMIFLKIFNHLCCFGFYLVNFFHFQIILNCTSKLGFFIWSLMTIFPSKILPLNGNLLSSWIPCFSYFHRLSSFDYFMWGWVILFLVLLFFQNLNFFIFLNKIYFIFVKLRFRLYLLM